MPRICRATPSPEMPQGDVGGKHLLEELGLVRCSCGRVWACVSVCGWVRLRMSMDAGWGGCRGTLVGVRMTRGSKRMKEDRGYAKMQGEGAGDSGEGGCCRPRDRGSRAHCTSNAKPPSGRARKPSEDVQLVNKNRRSPRNPPQTPFRALLVLRGAATRPTHLVPRADAVVGPAAPHVQRPKGATEQKRPPTQAPGLDSPHTEHSPRPAHHFHVPPVPAGPLAEGLPSPRLSCDLLSSPRLPQGRDLEGKASSRAEPAPKRLDSLGCVSSEGEDDLSRREPLEAQAVLGTRYESRLRLVQEYVRHRLRERAGGQMPW